MRQLFREQLGLGGPAINHRHARELGKIDEILRLNPQVTTLVLEDLVSDLRAPDEGRLGMTAEQVLRSMIVQRLNRYTYEELSFHLVDSTTYREFCGYSVFDPVPSKSTLQRNIKGVREATWREVHRLVLGYADDFGVENGEKTRTDGTVAETNIHPPSDSSLLYDAVRVIGRVLKEVHEQGWGIGPFPNRTRRAKRRSHEVSNAKNARKRKKAYRDLLVVTKEMVGYGRQALVQLRALQNPRAPFLAQELTHYVGLAECVIDQSERRVFDGEVVPADEKIVSIFEPHTDIIKKEPREIEYGHKLTLTAGASGLILDWVVEDGNPADSTLTVRSIERQRDIYGCVPRQAAFDGCFASKENLATLKNMGVRDVAFSKKRGLKIDEMASSPWAYRRLRNFRAGIEAWISYLKRAFGLKRCHWSGWEGFGRYVGASIVAANLLTLARHLLA